MPPPGPQKGAN